MKTLQDFLDQSQLFKTERLSILNWKCLEKQFEQENYFEQLVINILSPKVTKSLPDGWQHIDNFEKARGWIDERKVDSNFYVLSLNDTSKIVGFLFLYTEDGSNDLRLGYLLTESIWGKGMGSEFIFGLVDWAKRSKVISSISGGVEPENIGSIKVLEKNGFRKSDESLPSDALLYSIRFD